MKFNPHHLVINKELSYWYLFIISIFIMITSIGIFLYFFIRGNFHIHYIIATTCFWMLFCGLLIWLNAYLAKSQKLIELTYERTSKQVKRLGWLVSGSFWVCGLCLFAGLIFFAQQGNVWRYSILLFTVSILCLVTCIYGLIQRKITKQHYELKKQQQEIIELLSEKKMKEIKDISGGVLLT